MAKKSWYGKFRVLLKKHGENDFSLTVHGLIPCISTIVVLSEDVENTLTSLILIF